MNNCLKRALRTFLQAFFGFVSANAILSFQNVEELSAAKTVFVGLITAGIAAGAAAVMNLKENKND